MSGAKIFDCFKKDDNYDKGRICAFLTGVFIFAVVIWLIVLTVDLGAITGYSSQGKMITSLLGK